MNLKVGKQFLGRWRRLGAWRGTDPDFRNNLLQSRLKTNVPA